MDQTMQQTPARSCAFTEAVGEALAKILRNHKTLRRSEGLFPAGHRLDEKGITCAFWALLPRRDVEPPLPIAPQEIRLRQSGISFTLANLTAKVMRQPADGGAATVIYFEARIL